MCSQGCALGCRVEPLRGENPREFCVEWRPHSFGSLAGQFPRAARPRAIRSPTDRDHCRTGPGVAAPTIPEAATRTLSSNGERIQETRARAARRTSSRAAPGWRAGHPPQALKGRNNDPPEIVPPFQGLGNGGAAFPRSAFHDWRRVTLPRAGLWLPLRGDEPV